MRTPSQTTGETPSETLIALEKKFWQSLVDDDSDTAISMLNDPAIMVSGQGAIKVDHEMYRRMAEHGPMKLSQFELSDVQVVFPNDTTAVLTYHATQTVTSRGNSARTVQEVNDSSTWIKSGDRWRCVMHTETPALAAAQGRVEH
jgi:hypothetical protein